MPEQVKVFSRGSMDVFDELEKDANAWLTEHSGIRVISREVRTSTGENMRGMPFVNVTIVYFYRDKPARKQASKKAKTTSV